MEGDERDRQREKDEIAEIRRKLLQQGHPDPDAEMARVRALYRPAAWGTVGALDCGYVLPPTYTEVDRDCTVSVIKLRFWYRSVDRR